MSLKIKAETVVNKTFNRLTVLQIMGQDKHKKTKVLCQCSCGSGTKEVNISAILSGAIKSCGCISSEILIARNKNNATHGLRTHPLYGTAQKIISRATGKTERNSKYLERGIYEPWLDVSVLIAYLETLGPKPEGYSIDRINNDIGYFPNNLRWASRTIQNRNQSSNKLITYKGKTQCLSIMVKPSQLPIGVKSWALVVLKLEDA